MLPKWITENREIVNNFNDNVYGFVYLILYSDGKMYIGKKSLKSNVTKPSLKTKDHDGCVRKTFKFVYRDENNKIVTSRKNKQKLKEQGIKPTKEYYDECIIESNWKSYIGSSNEAKDRKDMIIQRKILSIQYDSKNLSYWENYELFKRNVLMSDIYINDNIMGTFFSGQIRE